MDNLQEISDWIEKIGKSKILVVVEGKKDSRALRELGISKVICLNKPLYEMAEKIASICRKCILLTDLDNEGKKLFRKLKMDLNKLGVKVDDSFRKFLFRKTELRQIEGLARYLSNKIRNKESKHASSS